MKEWLLKLALDLAADYLTAEQVAKWEESLVNGALPTLAEWKDKLVTGLREKAAQSDTKIDDALVDAADVFLTKLVERLRA